MNHFMFYAGCGYRQLSSSSDNSEAKTDPMAASMAMGYSQEVLDLIFAPHSAFSYEDLPSDYYGAYFAIYVFNPDSELTLGEQLLKFLESLGATSPQQAPNYESLPESETSRKDKQPSERNFSNFPYYAK